MCVRHLLVLFLLTLLPSVCSGQAEERSQKLQAYFASHKAGVLKFSTDIEKLNRNSDDWRLKKRGASIAFIHEDGRWHRIENWIGLGRGNGKMMGYFSEITSIGKNQRLALVAKRVDVDEDKFDSPVQFSDGEYDKYRNDEYGLSVTIQNQTEKYNSILEETFPLLFGRLFDEKSLDLSVKNATVTSTKQVEFLNCECELFEFENEAGKFKITCCPELGFAPLRIEILKGVGNTFRDGTLADSEGVVSLQKTYQYLELGKPGEESKFVTRFLTTYADGTKAGSRVVTKFRKIDQKVGEKELEVRFPIPEDHKMHRPDERK